MAAQQDSVDADFIIVGAGSAGCVMAARLSEDPSCRVVLLEAGGPDRNPWIHIPLGYGKTITDKRVNWCYETEPDPNLNGRRVFWPRGKVLGGSSSINGLVYIRGQAQDFDHWRQLGNTGWSFDDVLPYFKRSEDRLSGGDDLHGTGGPLAVSDVDEYDPISKAFIKSAVGLGFPRTDDFNGRTQEGAGYYHLTTRNGRRCSTAVGYLRPAMKRSNLRVITHALTEQVILDGSRATGRALSSGRPEAHGALCARSDLVRWGDQLATAPAALRHRPAGPSRATRDSHRSPSAGRRPKHAGSLPGPRRAEVPVPDHRQ